jgi:hypothetical protein
MPVPKLVAKLAANLDPVPYRNEVIERATESARYALENAQDQEKGCRLQLEKRDEAAKEAREAWEETKRGVEQANARLLAFETWERPKSGAH